MPIQQYPRVVNRRLLHPLIQILHQRIPSITIQPRQMSRNISRLNRIQHIHHSRRMLRLNPSTLPQTAGQCTLACCRAGDEP